MSAHDNGGPAFPHEEKHWGCESGEWKWITDATHTGMTLRDYFAAKAMHALMFDPERMAVVAGAENSIRLLADMSYDMADAMLKARQE